MGTITYLGGLTISKKKKSAGGWVLSSTVSGGGQWPRKNCVIGEVKGLYCRRKGGAVVCGTRVRNEVVQEYPEIQGEPAFQNGGYSGS